MHTPDPELTPEQNADAERIYQVLRQATEDEHWQLARMLASRRDERFFGQTEYEIRDLAHKSGAKAIQAALDGRKKGGTKARA